MSRNEKPLPKPPSTPFGSKKAGERREEQEPLTADRMTQAMAEGRLEEFLKQEMPDNEYARNLATMMMGMTGMLPAGTMNPSPLSRKPVSSDVTMGDQPAPPRQEVTEEAMKAILGGDVKGLMDILRREHQKRNPGAETGPAPAEEAPAPQTADMPTIDKELIDVMIQIAADNSVTLDWLILRAIKVYVEEYRKTGKL